MTGSYSKAEVLPGPERRRSWSTAEKLSIVQETYEADVTVSLVARRHGVAPNQLFRWSEMITDSEAADRISKLAETERVTEEANRVLLDLLKFLGYRHTVEAFCARMRHREPDGKSMACSHSSEASLDPDAAVQGAISAYRR